MRIGILTPTRLLVRVLAGAILTIVVLLALLGSASAKGPVSGMLSGPGIDHPIELVDLSNPDRTARLMEQTGIWYGTGDLPRPIESPPGELGPAYTLTWVNGGPPDLSVEERTIRQLIYLEAEGGPLIHTPPQASLGGWGSDVTGWFTAPAGLPDTLASLGVPIPDDSSFSFPSLPVLAPGVPLTLGISGFALIIGLVGFILVRHLARR